LIWRIRDGEGDTSKYLQTTAAVCGQVAGAYYGEAGSPSHWLECLALFSENAALVNRLGMGYERRA
jgi:ADP-ribosylglycohydrolase